MITLGIKIKHGRNVYRVIGDGYNHEGKYGYLCVSNDTRDFFLADECTVLLPSELQITPTDSALVVDKVTGRTVINYGCTTDTHRRCQYHVGQVLKDRYNNILTVMTRGDVVYYYCAAIDSKILVVDDDTEVIGNINTHCAITGKPLGNDVIIVRTKLGIMRINKDDKPEFIKQSFVSGNWYNPQNFHLILGKDYENLYIGFDELDKLVDYPDFAICKVTGVPFYIADERDIVKQSGIHPVLVDQFIVTCPISHQTGLRTEMIEGYISGTGKVYFHPSVKDRLVCHNGTYGATEEDFIFVEDLGKKFSKARRNEFYRHSNNKYYSSQSAAPLTGLHSYNFKPEPVFNGEGKKFLGIEMEFHRCGESNERADLIIGDLNKIVYAKHDGSLHDGMEFVTHPCTPQFHLSNIDYDKFFKRVQDLHGESSANSGLHIHVNRNFFKGNNEIAKIIRFVENNFDTLMLFACRTNEDSNWCQKYGMTVKELSQIYTVAKDENEKYRAINLCPSQTVEFRMFRSTQDVERIHAYIQFVDVITDLANMNSIRYIGWSNIARIAKNKKYIELRNVLQKTGLLKEAK